MRTGQWQRWAQQRIGVRAYLRSTFDRTGHNNTADASHYLYQVAENFNVTLDVEGSGVLYFVRTNHCTAVRGTTRSTTSITSSKNRRHAIRHRNWKRRCSCRNAVPDAADVHYATTHGADLKLGADAVQPRLRLAYSRTFYGTGYYIFTSSCRAWY